MLSCKAHAACIVTEMDIKMEDGPKGNADFCCAKFLDSKDPPESLDEWIAKDLQAHVKVEGCSSFRVKRRASRGPAARCCQVLVKRIRIDDGKLPASSSSQNCVYVKSEPESTEEYSEHCDHKEGVGLCLKVEPADDESTESWNPEAKSGSAKVESGRRFRTREKHVDYSKGTVSRIVGDRILSEDDPCEIDSDETENISGDQASTLVRKESSKSGLSQEGDRNISAAVNLNREGNTRTDVRKPVAKRVSAKRGQYRVKCNQCKKRFARDDKQGIYYHRKWQCVARNAWDLELVACIVCKKVFPRFQSYQHKRENKRCRYPNSQDCVADEYLGKGNPHHSKYKCKHCGRVFRESGYMTHLVWQCVAKSKNDARLVSCLLCNEKFQSFRLKQHKYEHKTGNIVTCPDCGKHMSKGRKGTKLHSCKAEKVSCKKCDPEVRMHARFMERHMKFVHDVTAEDLVECSRCGKKMHKLQRANHMAGHRKTDRHKLGLIPLQKCPLCEKFFAQKRGVERHVSMVHEKNREFACKKCGQNNWFSKSALKRHVEISHKKIYSCQLCPKYFQNKNQLTDHANVHEGKFPYKCDLCPNEKFSEKVKLRIHIGCKHRHSNVCSICGRTYATKATLKRHELTHDDVRRHQCLVCHQKFTQKAHMLRHLLIHTGEKPIVCELCGAAFRQMSLLKNHMAKQHKDRM